MALGPDRERVNNLITKTLRIGDVPIPKTITGQATVTGSDSITIPQSNSPGVTSIVTITGVSVTLAAAPVAGACFVAGTFSGQTATLEVFTSAYAASTTPTLVNYTISGF